MIIEMQTSYASLPAMHSDYSKNIRSQSYSVSPCDFFKSFNDAIMLCWTGFDPCAIQPSTAPSQPKPYVQSQPPTMSSQPKSYLQPQLSNDLMLTNISSAIFTNSYYSTCDMAWPIVQHSDGSTPMEHLSSIVAQSKLNPEAAEFWPMGWNKDFVGSMPFHNLVNDRDVLEEGLIVLESLKSSNANAEQRQVLRKSQEINRSASAEGSVSAACRTPVVNCNLGKEIAENYLGCNTIKSVLTSTAKEAERVSQDTVSSEKVSVIENSMVNSGILPKESFTMCESNSEAVSQESTLPKDPDEMPHNLLVTFNDDSVSVQNSVPPVVSSSNDSKSGNPTKNGFVTSAKPLYTEVEHSMKIDSPEGNLKETPAIIVSSKQIEENEDDRSGFVGCTRLLQKDVVSGVTFDEQENEDNLKETEDVESEDEDNGNDSLSFVVFDSSLDEIALGSGRRRNLSECSSLSSDSIVFSDSVMDLEDDHCSPDTSESCHRKDNGQTDGISLQWIQVDFSDDEDDVMFCHTPVVGLSSLWLQEAANVESSVPATRLNLECGLLVSFDDSDEEDDDDGDYLSAIIEVNQRWQSHCNDPPEKPKTSTKVRFKEAVMIKEVPADEDRKGPWALYALDTERFRRRIESCEKVLSPVLCPGHRDKVFSERCQGLA